MLAALGKNLERVKVHGGIPALSDATTAGVVVLYEVDCIPGHIELGNDILYLAVKHLPQPQVGIAEDPVDASGSLAPASCDVRQRLSSTRSIRVRTTCGCW